MCLLVSVRAVVLVTYELPAQVPDVEERYPLVFVDENGIAFKFSLPGSR